MVLSFYVPGYMICSSLLLIVNKLSVEKNETFMILALQLFSSSMISLLFCFNYIKFSKFMAYYWVSFAFLMCLSANMKVLQYSNIETFIIFRNTVPVLISILEWLFLEREFPNLKSLFILTCICACSSIYTFTDAFLSITSYIYVAIWYCIFCFDALFIKHRVDHIEVINNWERVFYQNTWSLLMLLFKFMYDAKVIEVKMQRDNLILISISCLISIGMSYFGLACRKVLSATYFTLIGNMCKFITILINVYIWDKHASYTGLICLFISLIIGFFYVQSPKREIENSIPLLQTQC